MRTPLVRYRIERVCASPIGIASDRACLERNEPRGNGRMPRATWRCAGHVACAVRTPIFVHLHRLARLTTRAVSDHRQTTRFSDLRALEQSHASEATRVAGPCPSNARPVRPSVTRSVFPLFMAWGCTTWMHSQRAWRRPHPRRIRHAQSRLASWAVVREVARTADRSADVRMAHATCCRTQLDCEWLARRIHGRAGTWCTRRVDAWTCAWRTLHAVEAAASPG